MPRADLIALAKEWWFESRLSAAPGEVREKHEDDLAALLAKVDREATERAAMVCDEIHESRINDELVNMRLSAIGALHASMRLRAMLAKEAARG